MSKIQKLTSQLATNIDEIEKFKLKIKKLEESNK